MKSDETSASLFVQRMPLYLSVAASLTIASLISSAVTLSLFTTNLKSTSETSGVGTRVEAPSSLPANSGITRPIALAAPVVVGIMFCAAERER